MSVTMQLRRGTAALWASTNPVLAAGEAGLETDTLRLKYGDGTSAWSALAYADASTAKTNVANTFTEEQAFAAGLATPKTAATGIKVDTDAPTWGWRDLTADIQVRGLGVADPSFAVYGATVMRAFQFSAATEKEVFFVYHVPHDWVPSTPIYFHAHWSNAAATPNTGSVVWGFDYSFAKGFNQEAFPTPTSVTVTQACPATRYRHMVAETVAVTIPTMEVDGLILVRGYRKAADAADTCTDAVFLHTMDIHYQSTNMATKNKAPGFYA